MDVLEFLPRLDFHFIFTQNLQLVPDLLNFLNSLSAIAIVFHLLHFDPTSECYEHEIKKIYSINQAYLVKNSKVL